RPRDRAARRSVRLAACGSQRRALNRPRPPSGLAKKGIAAENTAGDGAMTRLLVATALCATAAVAAGRPAPLLIPRNAARQVLQAQGCGSCHDRAVSREHAGALAVDDLRDQDWPG